MTRKAEIQRKIFHQVSVNEIRLLSEVPSGFTEIEAIFWKLVFKKIL